MYIFLNIIDALNFKTNTSENFHFLEFKNLFTTMMQVQSMFIESVMKLELESGIKSLKNGTSPRIGGISSNILKYIYPKISDVR